LPIAIGPKLAIFSGFRSPGEENSQLCPGSLSFSLTSGKVRIKMAGQISCNTTNQSTGGSVKKALKLQALGALLLMGAGGWIAGCKSKPELSQADAQKLIQAYYDQQPPTTFIISVNETGLKQGFDAKYWKLVKVYPNKRWADYELTDEGKKVLTLNGGGTMIQWRPDDSGMGHFFVTTVTTYHPKVKDVQDPQDDVVPGVETAKSDGFTETVNLTGVPDPLQAIAHNPGNVLTSRRHADFALDGGNWKVHDVH
jgi:hypothetical protein